MSRGMSAAEPTFRWDILIESSPGGSASHTGPSTSRSACVPLETILHIEQLEMTGPSERSGRLTGDPGREGAPRDVLVIVFDQDAVVSRQDGQVGHCARPVLVVHTADVCF